MQVFESTVVAAPVDRVWAVVGDFNGLPQWSPRIASSEIEGGSGEGPVGSVRRLVRDDGVEIAERLLAYDTESRRLTYRFEGEAPFAARNYRGTVTAAPVTDADGDATFVTWSCTFDADASESDTLAATFSHVFRTGLGHLRTLFG